MPSSAEQQLREWWKQRLPLWRADPLLWIKEVLGGPQPWSRQEEILHAIATHDEVNVATGHAVGKDWLMARVALWWAVTHQDSVVLTTAPTEKQVETILWGEIRNAYKSSRFPLGGELLPVDPLLRFSERWYAKGLVARDVNSLQGFRGPGGVLVIIDEAAGIPPWAEEALLGCATTANSKIVRIGNPTCGPTHAFAKAFVAPGPRAKCIRISSLETPNCVAGREVIPGLMTLEAVARIERKYGRGSDQYRARVLGQFPAGSSDSLISAEHIEAAHARWVDGPMPKGGRFGVDVARFGDDLTVIAYAADGKAWVVETVAKADGVKVARRLAELVKQYEAKSVALDGGGLGAGPVDALVDLQRREVLAANVLIYECDFGAGATDKTEWANKRTELWHRLRDWLWTEGALAPDPELEEELLSVTRRWRSGTATILEPKDAVKARLGRSPDRADALALAVAGHVGKVKQRGVPTVHWV